MCSGVLVFPSLQELEELLRPPLLKQAHQRALHGLHLGTGDLGDPAIAVDKAARDLLELEVTGDVSVHKDLRELSRCDDEFRYEIDGIVPVATELRRGALVWSEFAIQLEEYDVAMSSPATVRTEERQSPASS